MFFFLLEDEEEDKQVVELQVYELMSQLITVQRNLDLGDIVMAKVQLRNLLSRLDLYIEKKVEL